jgi:hypothetical protein
MFTYPTIESARRSAKAWTVVAFWAPESSQRAARRPLQSVAGLLGFGIDYCSGRRERFGEHFANAQYLSASVPRHRGFTPQR